MFSVSLVIAAYNEAATLEAVFLRCLKVLEDCADDYEIVILNDGSRDGTAAVAERLLRTYPQRVRLITHETNLGIAATFEELYAAATRECVFDVPADGEYPPEALREILPMMQQYDIVVCQRRYKRYTLYRRIVSFFYRLLPKLLFGVELYDPGSTKCRRRKVISEVQLTSRGVFAEAERMIRSVRRGYRLGRVVVEPERRLAGDPRGARLRNVVEAVGDLVNLWIRLVVLRQKP